LVPPIALLALRVGFVTLLWLFVLAVLLALRSDLFGVRPARAATPRKQRPQPAAAAPRPQKKKGTGGIPRLVVTEGALAGTTMTLGEAPVTIGRADSCTLVLTDDFVSGHHARVFPQQGRWWVEDLGSTNGTILDRTKLTGPAALEPGSAIRIGRTVLELRS
jgi:pSer/pThr/pTyr-binding forkhead associated (FHA) protein